MRLFLAQRIRCAQRAASSDDATNLIRIIQELRKIRELVRDVLGELNRSLGRLYASEGRPSIPPEQLLSQVFCGIRSERQLMEQLNYNLMYRWFVGLSPDDPVWDPTTFTKNRDRL
jgi:transposase